MEKICSCYRPFKTLNPWRKLCDRCRELRRDERGGGEIVVLDVADSEIEASIWKDMLDKEGIPAMLNAIPSAAGAVYAAQDLQTGYEVRVFRRDLETALQVIHGEDGGSRRNEGGF